MEFRKKYRYYIEVIRKSCNTLFVVVGNANFLYMAYICPVYMPLSTSLSVTMSVHVSVAMSTLSQKQFVKYLSKEMFPASI